MFNLSYIFKCNFIILLTVYRSNSLVNNLIYIMLRYHTTQHNKLLILLDRSHVLLELVKVMQIGGNRGTINTVKE